MTQLNTEQQEAVERFFAFMLSDARFFGLSGKAGTGKTYLAKHLIECAQNKYQKYCQLVNIPQNIKTIKLCATTNKACKQLQKEFPTADITTIHSYLGLKVVEDNRTGKSHLVPEPAIITRENHLLLIDEVSMIDQELMDYIHNNFADSKIILMGDIAQLPPVGSFHMPAFNSVDPAFMVFLTKQMRNLSQPTLQNTCDTLRAFVVDGSLPTINPQSGVLEVLSEIDFLKKITDTFDANLASSVILTYTNKKALQYDDHINKTCHSNSDYYVVGKGYFSNSYIPLKQPPNGNAIIHTDDFVSLSALSPTARSSKEFYQSFDLSGITEFNFKAAVLKTSNGVMLGTYAVPLEKYKWQQAIKDATNFKRWALVSNLKSSFVDLRTGNAMTVHKSQGSTFDTVFIDLDDLSKVRDKNQLARMLYVAFSRAQNKIYCKGDLKL